MNTTINPNTDNLIKARGQREYLLILGGLGLFLGYRLSDDFQGTGMSGAVLALVLIAGFGALMYRISYQKPRFVVSDTGVSFPWITGEVRWEEVESMRAVADGLYPWSQLQLEVRNPGALADRVTVAWLPLALLYSALGQMRWFTAMNASHSPIPLEQLADEIERRAGRTLRVS